MMNHFLKGLILVILPLAFYSCYNEPVQEDVIPTIRGYWEASNNGGDSFEITQTTFTYYYNKVQQFKGTIVNDPDWSSKSGYLTLLITEQVETWNPETGKYYRMRWENFDGKGIKAANAYKDGGSNTGLATRAEAEAEYTKENGYYGWYGVYAK
jgi:hypothetical protein